MIHENSEILLNPEEQELTGLPNPMQLSDVTLAGLLAGFDEEARLLEKKQRVNYRGLTNEGLGDFTEEMSRLRDRHSLIIDIACIVARNEIDHDLEQLLGNNTTLH